MSDIDLTSKTDSHSQDDSGTRQSIKAEGGSTISDVTQIIGDHHEHHYYPAPTTPTPSLIYLPPKAYHRLVGRFDEIDRVMNALREQNRKPMIAIIGLGGIGKTALAREAADQGHQERLFDYIVWTSAKTERFVGEGTVKTEVSDYNFDELLSDIGRQCDRIDIAKMPPDQKREAVKYLLANRRVLVVMDNLETVQESEKLIDDLFQILGQSKILITSRHHIKHDQVFIIDLSGFPEEEGIIFLREESKERGIEVVVQAERKKLLEIHQVTGGAPLAMKLVVGQMNRLPMADVLKLLREARFEGQDYEFYRFIFKHSWDLLEFDAKKVLVSLSVFALTIGGTPEAIKEASAVEARAFGPAIDQLVLMSLVDTLGTLEQRRYTIHQLTNYFILSDIVKKWG